MSRAEAPSMQAVWRWLRWPTTVSVCVVTAALVWQQQLSFSASANDALAGFAGLPSPPHGMIGRALRGLGKLLAPGDLGGLIIHLQLVFAALLLLLMVTVGRLVGLADKALALPLLLVLLPSGRDALGTVGIETVLSLLTLALCIGICGMERFPRLAALLVGGCLYTTAIAHPMGGPALIALIIVAGMWPRPRGPRPATVTFAARPIWLPWLAAVSLCGALLLLSLPDDRIKALWDTTIELLRTTTAGPAAGGVGDWPLVGPLFVISLSLPLPVLLLAAVGAVRALKSEACQPAAVLAALLCAWLLTACVVGTPSAGPLDLATVVAPLATILAGRELWSACQRLWPLGNAGRAACVALLVASIATIVLEDLGNPRDDPRNGAARIGQLVKDHNADRPARIDAADIALLRAHPETTAILPSNRGGNALARRLAKLGIVPGEGTYVRPFAARLVLVHMPAKDPISHAWASLRAPVDCDAGNRSCLYRVKPRDKK
jgi:hypothetical protein